MKIVDLNVLLYAVDRNSPTHAEVHAWWEEALNGDESIGFAWVVLAGFLRLAANPHVFPDPMPVSTVFEQVDEWLGLSNVRIVQETRDHWNVLQRLLQQTGKLGNAVNDAHLAALALTHGATLVSCDWDFARFADLRWENPLDRGRRQRK